MRFLYITLFLSLFAISNGIYAFDNSDSPAMLDPFLERQLSHDSVLHLYYSGGPDASGYDDEKRYSVVIHGDANTLDSLPIHVNSRLNGFATANVTFDELYDISRLPGISMLEKGADMEIFLDESLRDLNAELVHAGQELNRPFTGKGVIIGIIDTGIDIFHPDFRDIDDNRNTRIISLWDAELFPQEGETPPQGFDFGVEYTREDIESDLARGSRSRVRSSDTNGHGTHVAGIAGGNGAKGSGRFTGVAPDAEFIIVAFPNGRFSSSRIIDGMNYIFQKADELGKPVVVNLSLGGHGGGHDGRAPQERAIDEFVQQPGRAVVVSAGNSGSRNIHTGGVNISANSFSTFSMDVSHSIQDNQGGNNLILNLLWYESDRGTTPNATLTVTTPNGYETSVSSLGQDTTHTDDGRVIIADFVQSMTEPQSRVFLIEITNNNTTPPARGIWNFRLQNDLPAASFTYNMWIVATSLNGGTAEAVQNTGRRFTVSIPGTAREAVTVAAYTTKRTWRDADGLQRGIDATLNDLAIFSSGGPTRDGRLKPEISAPGQVIAATFSGDASAPAFLRTETDGYRIMQGTSMSAPQVAGIIALMFEANPTLTSNQMRNIFEDTGRSDSFATSLPNNDWGHGKANALAAVQEAAAITDIVDDDPSIPQQFALFQNFPNPFNPITTIRFTILQTSHVTLVVYDVLGRKVQTLVNEQLDASDYSVTFNASSFSSGIYYYRLEAGSFIDTKRMTVLQ